MRNGILKIHIELIEVVHAKLIFVKNKSWIWLDQFAKL